jgi:hypothetical protein
MLLIWGAIYLASIAVPLLLIYRSSRIKELVTAFVERLSSFLYLYLPLSFASLLLIVWRNLA